MGFLHEQFILPLGDLLRGTQVHKYLKLMDEAQEWTPSQTAAFQQERLRRLIVHAATEVPFYRDWFFDHCIDPGTATLDQLPIVSKSIMRQEGLVRFSAEHFPAKERIASASSGSTGEPFSFFTTKEADSVNAAAKIMTWYNTGYHLGDRYVKIAYQPRPMIKKWQDRLNNCTYLQFTSPGEADMDCLLRQVGKARPTIIRAHANVAFYLAQAQQRLHLSITPRVVMTTATNLTASYREAIQKAFGCEVIDSYSCEGTPCVYETPLHDGYHICQTYGIIETLDDDGRPVQDGLAHVISTDLWNMAQPFIRYDTLDVVEMKSGVIVRIAGRDNEQFTAKNGRVFTGYAVGDYFALKQKEIDTYQIVCKKDDSLEIRIIPGHGFVPQQANQIEEHWRQATGQQVTVKTTKLPILSPNSKQKTIIHE